MGKLGAGYGSEYQLRRFMSDRVGLLNDAITRSIAMRGEIEWLPFPVVRGSVREWKGMEFLDAGSDALGAWKKFWPSTGNPQNWDAVGRFHIPGGASEWLLVEAKARSGELISPACGAKGAGRTMIENALRATQRHFEIETTRDWMSSYYQIANRLASLYFLNELAKEPARMVFLYFTGDRFPDGSHCPATENEWRPHVERANRALGLPDHVDRVHHVYVPVSGAQTW